MEKTPLTKDIKQLFKTSPPDFLYCVNCKKSVVYLYINKYSQLSQDGKPIPLFIRNNHLKRLNGVSSLMNQ